MAEASTWSGCFLAAAVVRGNCLPFRLVILVLPLLSSSVMWVADVDVVRTLQGGKGGAVRLEKQQVLALDGCFG